MVFAEKNFFHRSYPLSICMVFVYSWNVCNHVGEVYCRYPVAYLYFKPSLSLLSSLPCCRLMFYHQTMQLASKLRQFMCKTFVLAVDPSSWTLSINFLMMPLGCLCRSPFLHLVTDGFPHYSTCCKHLRILHHDMLINSAVL